MEYEGAFGENRCLVVVEARPSVSGGPVYIATPYILKARSMQGFAREGRPVECPGGTEKDALARAADFLVGHFGPQTGSFERPGELRSPLEIEKPLENE